MSVTTGLVPVSSPVWRDALGLVPYDVFHLPAYADVDAKRQQGTAKAFVYRDGDNALLIPLVVRPIPDTACVDAISPYGYGGPTGSAHEPAFWRAGMAAFQEALQDEQVVSCLLRLHPLMPSVGDLLDGIVTVVEHGETVSIDLTPDEQVIEHFTRANHRRDINRAVRRGHTTEVDDWSQLDEFLEMYDETMDRVGASDEYRIDLGYVPSLRGALGDAVHLVTVRQGGVTTAGGVFFETCGLVGYHLGATRTSALPDGPSKLMIDATWRWARRRGCHTLHLGGGVGGTSGGSLFHFKAGFSPLRHCFRTARLVLDVETYTRLCAGDQEDLTSTTFFPGYRAPEPRTPAGAASAGPSAGRKEGPWLSQVP